MKQMYKLMIFLVAFFVLMFTCYADLPEDYVEQTEEMSELKELLNKYCQGDTTKGCLYTEQSKSKYQTVKDGTSFMVGYEYADNADIQAVRFVLKNMKFEKAYTSINSVGNSVVGACYSGYVSNDDKNFWGSRFVYSSIPSDKQNYQWHKIFLLRVFSTQVGVTNYYCDNVAYNQVVFADKEKAYSSIFNLPVTNTSYITRDIDTTGYESIKNDQCPKYMAYTKLSTIQRWFSSQKEYLFTDNDKVQPVTNYIDRVLNVNKDGKITGCTEKDVDGEKKTEECYENIKNVTIGKYTCPDKLSDIKLEPDKYISECAARYRTDTNTDLESAKYVKEQQEKWSKEIKASATKKVEECYKSNLMSKCSLSSSVVDTITSSLKSGGCYFDCSSSVTSCSECYSSTSTTTCSCFTNALSSLTDTQKTCVINYLKDANTANTNNNKNIDDAYQKDADTTNSKNEEKRNTMYQNSLSTFTIPGLSDGGFGPVGQDCKTVLGSNGVKVVVGIVNVVRIVGVIIAIANGMITLIPAVISKDADGLKKAEKKLVVIAVALAIIGILPTIVYLIGGIFEFDLSCLFSI